MTRKSHDVWRFKTKVFELFVVLDKFHTRMTWIFDSNIFATLQSTCFTWYLYVTFSKALLAQSSIHPRDCALGTCKPRQARKIHRGLSVTKSMLLQLCESYNNLRNLLVSHVSIAITACSSISSFTNFTNYWHPQHVMQGWHCCRELPVATACQWMQRQKPWK